MSAAFFPGYDEESEYLDVLKERAKEKAKFCLATGVQPSEYDELTQIEINAFIAEANRQARKGSK